ncbi:MAG: TetR/AcrR family transcriptional regulator [Wenzhouxiangellaceae bacterium]
MVRVSSKDKIIDAAMRCFRSEGYLATSVDEIIAEAGVSKGSFYHAFKSKEMLGLETIEHYLQHVTQVLRQGPHQHIKDPWERVIAYVEHTEAKAAELWCQGCMMGSFSIDLAHSHPAVRAKLKSLFQAMTEEVARLFEPALAQLDHCQLNASDLANQYISQVQGAIVLGQAHGDVAVTQQCIRSFRHYLQQLKGE